MCHAFTAGLLIYLPLLCAMEVCYSTLWVASVHHVFVLFAYGPSLRAGRGIVPRSNVRSWVHPTVAVTSSVTRSLLFLVGFVVPCPLPPSMALGCGHHVLDIGALPTRT
jgi:hypothetical protein